MKATGARHILPALLMLAATVAGAQELRLAAPAAMAESGFLRHILPRFKLKHRLTVAPVAAGAEAEMALIAGGDAGTRVFADAAGQEFRLVLRTETADTAKFADWLRSGPGRAAIAGFPRGGPPAYVADLPETAAEPAPEITGDAALGSKLAILHCGRCHVVDRRNRMGGIGSTPSFGAMRARPHWFDLFTRYWSANPHPSFTEVVGVTPAFGDTHVSAVAPVRLTLEEIDAIVAFVETLPPKDLGRPIQPN